MSLGLNISTSTARGRRPVLVEAEVIREINDADLELLAQPGTEPANIIKRLTDRHHSLARLLASGTPENECAAIVGYHLSRVSILKADPAFQELLALYQREVKTQFATTLEHMSGLSRDALLELRDRLEETPEKFTNNELRVLVTDMIDRTAQDDDGESAGKLPTIIELVAPEVQAAPDAGEEEVVSG